ncbi:MAG: hypothetical protein V4646_19080 [Pseudomonadota bacterium]
MIFKNKTPWLWAVGLLLLFPLFFQLRGGVYRDINPVIDSQGVLATLPLPVSLVACMTLFVFLTSRSVKRIFPALVMIGGVILVSLISLWLGSDGVVPPQRKLLMIAQVMLPLAGLMLGQLVDDRDKIIAQAFLVVVSIVVPLQLLASWLQGGLILTHYLYAFSIYSHFQYVTLIFVCAFAFSLTSLWEEHRVWLCIMIIPMLAYATASLSFLTIFAYLCVMVVLASLKLYKYRAKVTAKSAAIFLILAVAAGAGALAYFREMSGTNFLLEKHQRTFHGKFKSLAEGKIPTNVQERLDDWKFFGSAIFESKKTVLVGHPQPMPREIKSSPHNWYIDMGYTFGLVGIFPVLMLVAYTAGLCWKHRRTLPAETWWLAALVFYMVIVDSNFKVTLRQPYPGIFAYFMWGLLLSRLRIPLVSRQGT